MLTENDLYHILMAQALTDGHPDAAVWARSVLDKLRHTADSWRLKAEFSAVYETSTEVVPT